MIFSSLDIYNGPWSETWYPIYHSYFFLILWLFFGRFAHLELCPGHKKWWKTIPISVYKSSLIQFLDLDAQWETPQAESSGIMWYHVPSIWLMGLNFTRKMRMAQKFLMSDWANSCNIDQIDGQSTPLNVTLLSFSWFRALPSIFEHARSQNHSDSLNFNQSSSMDNAAISCEIG